MKKLLMNLTVLTSLGVSGNSVISGFVQNTNSKILNQKINDVHEAVDITDVLTNLDLGFIETGGVNPSETQVKNYISKFNPDVNTAYVSVNGITSNYATVTGTSPLYYGSVKVTFIIEQLVDLSEVLSEVNLGNILTQEDKPTVNQIQTALKSNGINPDLDTNAIIVENITATSARILGDELKYTGSIDVNFTLKKIDQLVNWNNGAIRAITINANGIFVGTNNGNYTGKIYKSEDNGQNFVELSGTTGAIYSLVSDKNGNVYAAADTSVKSGKVYVSDGASAFSIISGIPEDSTFKFSAPKYLNIDDHGNIYVAVRYTNFGFVSTEVYKSLGTTGFRIIGQAFDDDDGAPLSVAVDKNGTVFVGTRIEGLAGKGVLYKYMNGDTRFQKVSGINAEVHSLECDKNGNIFVGVKTGDTSGTVYVGSNNNTTFNLLSGTIGSVYALKADEEGNVYAGTRTTTGNGALYKSSGGSNFSVSSGTAGSVYGIGFDEANKALYVGTSINTTTGNLYRGV